MWARLLTDKPGKTVSALVAPKCLSSQESPEGAGLPWRSSEIPWRSSEIPRDRDRAASGGSGSPAQAAGLVQRSSEPPLTLSTSQPILALPRHPDPHLLLLRIKWKKKKISPSSPLPHSLSPCPNHGGSYSKDIIRSSKFLVRAMESSSRRVTCSIPVRLARERDFKELAHMVVVTGKLKTHR